MDDLLTIQAGSQPADQPADQAAESARYKTLSNGAVYDLEAKRIVKGPMLTNDTARQMVAAREAKRAAVARQAANAAVERADYKANYGDMAYLAAIIETAMYKATSADDPKAIEAARFVMMQTGDYSDGQTASQAGSQAADQTRGILADLAAIARAILSEADRPADVIDGQVADQQPTE